MRVILAVATMVTTGVQAGPYDGAYLTRLSIDIGGAPCATSEARDIWFIDDRYNVAGDFECNFRNPVPVRDMNAVLYDVECVGSGSPEGVFREMIVTTEDGLVMVGNWGAGELVKCD